MGFEKLQRHQFWKPTLIHSQIRSYDDDGPAGEVHPFSKKVLSKSSLLSFDDLAQRFQRSLVRPFDGVASSSVVDEGVHRLLKHPLFISYNDLGSVEFHKSFETLVSIDDSAIEVVDVADGKLSTIQSYERSKIWWEDRNDGEHHPLRSIPAVEETLDHFEALDDGFSLRLGICLLHLLFELFEGLHKIELLQKLLDHFATHSRIKSRIAKVLDQLLVLLFVEYIVLFDRIFLLKIVIGLTRIFDDVGFVVEYPLQIFHLYAKQRSYTAWKGVDIPDVRYWSDQLDMAHSASAHFARGHLYTTLLTHHPFVAHLFVLTAKTLVIFDRAKDLGAKKPVSLWL